MFGNNPVQNFLLKNANTWDLGSDVQKINIDDIREQVATRQGVSSMSDVSVFSGAEGKELTAEAQGVFDGIISGVSENLGRDLYESEVNFLRTEILSEDGLTEEEISNSNWQMFNGSSSKGPETSSGRDSGVVGRSNNTSMQDKLFGWFNAHENEQGQKIDGDDAYFMQLNNNIDPNNQISESEYNEMLKTEIENFEHQNNVDLSNQQEANLTNIFQGIRSGQEYTREDFTRQVFGS